MVGAGTRSSATAAQHPIRQSPRKPSNPSLVQPVPTAQAPHLLPTPLSNSPSTSSGTTQPRYPPQFDHSHPMHYPTAPSGPASLSHSISVSARASTALYTPRSPYRPGEYGRRPETASERTKIERRLFGEDEDEMARMREEEEEEEGWKRNRGSSPLQPAFEARLILRKGAPVDLISWLRRNFHHIPSPSHPSLTSSTSLLAIRALLAERFPRLPESEELVKAVTAAFPRVHMDYGPVGSEEPPMIRGLVWNGKETVYEDTRGEKEKRLSLELAKGQTGASVTPDKKAGGRSGRNVSGSTTNVASASAFGHTAINGAGAKYASAHGTRPSITTGPLAGGGIKSNHASRSPTQSTLVSPTTSSSRRLLPNTPARSVLEEFAVLATLADKTPATKTQSLPGDRMVVPSMAYKLASICDSFGGSGSVVGEDTAGPGRSSSKRRPSGVNANGKRRASTPPLLGESSTTPDKLEGLLAAAETIEGSPMASFLDNPTEGRAGQGQHKRRRTIGGMGSMREVMEGGNGKGRAGWNGDVAGSPGRQGSGRMLGGLELVPEDKGEMGSASDAEQQVVAPPKLKGRGKASVGTAGRGRGRGRGGKSAAGSVGKGRAHAESNASQMSISAVSTIAGGPSMSGMEVDPETPGSHSMGMGHPSGLGLTYPIRSVSGQSIDGQVHPHPSFSPAASTSSHVYPTHGHPPGTPNGSGSRSSSFVPHPNYPRPRKSNELPTDGLYPGIDCKPPHPYHEMIRHAIESAPEGRLQLSQIYSSIAERFPFFAGLDERKTAGWQNSIRHNLSLKKMFVRVNKVDGVPDEGGKGGWWTVEPGIPDEGRPGRKSKSASAVAAAVAAGLVVDPLAGPGPAWKIAAEAEAGAGAGHGGGHGGEGMGMGGGVGMGMGGSAGAQSGNGVEGRVLERRTGMEGAGLGMVMGAVPRMEGGGVGVQGGMGGHMVERR